MIISEHLCEDNKKCSKVFRNSDNTYTVELYNNGIREARLLASYWDAEDLAENWVLENLTITKEL
jgi:hypothetical protein